MNATTDEIPLNLKTDAAPNSTAPSRPSWISEDWSAGQSARVKPSDSKNRALESPTGCSCDSR